MSVTSPKAHRVAVVMGSRSDLPTMQPAADILTTLEVSVWVEVVSAHRTAEKMCAFARGAQAAQFEVLIAGAGGAAHLPGMLAAQTTLPVIGVPVNATPLLGLDSLLSIVQMPAGVPVATVAINGAKNAGLLAARILAVSDAALRSRLQAWQEELAAASH